MKIAVVMPVYNVEPYLREALDSLLAQTHTDWAAYLVDDGSTDGSGAIADEYAARDPRFVVLHGENAGQGAARNRGLDLIFAKGARGYDAVTFLDSDDMLVPEAYAEATAAMEREKAAIVQYGFCELSEDGTLREREYCRESGPLTPDEYHASIYSHGEWAIANGCFGNVWSRLFAADLVRGVRFTEDREKVEDENFCSQIAVEGSLYFLARSLVVYRIRSASQARSADSFIKALRGRLLTLGMLRARGEENSVHAYYVRCAVARFMRLAARMPYEAAEQNEELLAECARTALPVARELYRSGELPEEGHTLIVSLAEGLGLSKEMKLRERLDERLGQLRESRAHYIDVRDQLRARRAELAAYRAELSACYDELSARSAALAASRAELAAVRAEIAELRKNG